MRCSAPVNTDCLLIVLLRRNYHDREDFWTQTRTARCRRQWGKCERGFTLIVFLSAFIRVNQRPMGSVAVEPRYESDGCILPARVARVK